MPALSREGRQVHHHQLPNRHGTRFGLSGTGLLMLLASSRISPVRAPAGTGTTGSVAVNSGAGVATGDLIAMGTQDAELNESIESDKLAIHRFEITGVSPGTWSGDMADVVLHGRFMIHGISREADLPARVDVGADQVRVRAQAPFNLHDSPLGGPSRTLSLLGMHEDILVHLDLTFGSSPAWQAQLEPASGGPDGR